ncbi:MAG: hypothetical protein ABIO70_27930 [Pseudomonadota bacterium]
MTLPLLALPVLLALTGDAWAGLPVELPPGEAPATWEPALLMAQQLLPDLELGPALGPGPSVRIVAAEETWLLDVAGSMGRHAPVYMPIPRDDDARTELLLVCADLLARDQPPPAPAEVPSAVEEPAPTPWALCAPRAAVGFWLPLGAGPQAAGSLESGGLAWRNLSASARLALASPVYVTEALSLRTSHLTLQMRATWRERPSIEAGVESGVSLRRILVDGEEALRDWTPAVGTGVGLGWPIPGGWRVTVSGSALAALPPAVLVTSRGDEPVPSWTLQISIGMSLPSLVRPTPAAVPAPEPTAGAPSAEFPRSKRRAGVTSS